MGKQGPVSTSDFSGNVALGRANSVVADLLADKAVPDSLVHDAKETFLNELWSGKAESEDAAQRGLVAIYGHANDPAARAEMIGDLFAAGRRGRAALQELMGREPSTRLTHDDLNDFDRNADRSLAQRLEIITNKLAAEAERHRPHGSGDHPPEHLPGAPRDAARLPPEEERSTRAGRVVPGRSDPPDTDDTLPKNDDPVADVKNTRLSHERRQARAIEAGGDAVPLLISMLRGKNQDERELALSTLIHLGRTKDLGRTVYQEMVHLEARVPEARRAAELVRSAIEGHGDRPDGRGRLRDTSVSDGWLRAALKSCNAPSILRAAAGREVLAISLGTRRLHELREELEELP